MRYLALLTIIALVLSGSYYLFHSYNSEPDLEDVVEESIGDIREIQRNLDQEKK